jgi:hypothetical protein
MKTPLLLLATGLAMAFPFQGLPLTVTPQISNLAVPWVGPGIGNIQAVTPDQRFGFGFTGGADPSRLDSVVLEHIDYPGSLQSFAVELYQINGFGPFGSVSVSYLGSLGNAVIDSRPTQWPGDTTHVRYSSASDLIIEPGNQYMIAALEPADGINQTGLLFAEAGSGYSFSDGWSTTSPYRFFGDSSGTWISGGFVSSGDLKIEITASLVPEPSMVTLLALGIGWCRFRRR